MVDRIGPLAMTGCEPRQARKGAAAAADSCAGVWLIREAALFWLSGWLPDDNKTEEL